MLELSPIVYVESLGSILLFTFDLKSVVSELTAFPSIVLPNTSVSGASTNTLPMATILTSVPASTLTSPPSEMTSTFPPIAFTTTSVSA